jgi:nicotinate dehydrogenase subunit A
METLKLRVNGIERELRAEPATPLLYILRNDLGLKGTRFGCGEGQCGACTVLLDGKPMQSCDMPLWSAAGHDITTVEGLSRNGVSHPLQQAFIGEQAAQGGSCINGIMMSAAALLERNPDPSEAEITAALDRNLCRCGTHVRILRAIARAAAMLRAARNES